MEIEADSGQLSGHLALPDRAGGERRYPGLVILHGFPTAVVGAGKAGQSYATLADRIAKDKNWVVFVLNYRGCGDSAGNFSLAGWLDDVRAAVAAVHARPDVRGVWIMGFGTGGALAICAAENDPRVLGVAAVAPPADFADWASDPERLLEHARDAGAISDESFPEDFDAWAAELGSVRAVDSVAALSSRSLLIVHGGDDETVPAFDARIIADAHGSAELRIVQGAGHRLRYDPRPVAILLGWLDRQRYARTPEDV